MTPEHWQQIDTLFQAVLHYPLDERSALLDDACADKESREEVESLIFFHQQAENFLEVPVFEAAAKLFFEDRIEAMIGLTIGSYKIEAQLGAGGMGEVYLAEDTKLDRKVAIKFLPLDLEADEQARMRLIREAKAAAKLDHQNICATYEVAEEDGRSFIVMQYVEGETLASKIQRKPLELGESLDMVIQVADSLVEAHSRGIIHRDIKPQNIMITPRGQVRVLDFGLAKIIEPAETAQTEAQYYSLLSVPGIIVGTAPYMSPEQAKGAPVDARSDLFSLGAMLYECIAGRPPFSGFTPMEICAQVIHVDPPPPSHLNPHVSPDLNAVTLKALAKEPGVRYQSASDFLEDLRAVRSASAAKDQGLTGTAPLKVRASGASGLTTFSRILQRPRVFVLAVVVLALTLWSFKGASPWGRAAPHQASAESLFWYEEGTKALRNGAYYEASKALKLAVEADDKDALAHAKLAEAWMEMDYQGNAYKEWASVTKLVPDRSTLPPLKALYLEAINLTLTHNFAGAIDSYEKIVQQTPDSDKAYAYLDLGRAYEKNDEIDKAIVSYQEAANRDATDAAAFLRLGILYTQKQDEEKALDGFQKAEQYYQNPEGIAEVIYQRGVLLNDRGKRDKARTELEQALKISEATDNQYQQIGIMLELGRVSFLEGKTTLAQEYATEAINLAQANDMENLSVRGLVRLGQTFFRRGAISEAETYFKKALDFARRNKGRRNEAMAQLALGNLCLYKHDADEGLRNVEPALEFYKESGYRREALKALRQIGDAYALKGNYSDTLRVYEEALELARELDDKPLLAAAHADIGYLLADQERYSEALHYFIESYTINESINDQIGMGNRLIDRGNMLWRLGRYEDARAALDKATFLAEILEDRNEYMLAKIPRIRASLALSEGRLQEARATGQQVIESIAEDENELVVEAMYTLGLARTRSGAKHAGRLLCEEAAEKAVHKHYLPLLPGALLALAEARLEDGDAQNALGAALEAQKSFATGGQKESEWRAWLIAMRACQRLGDDTTARDYASRAEGVLSNLQQVWEAGDYNDYLTRPDIKKLLSHLRQSMAGNQ